MADRRRVLDALGWADDRIAPCRDLLPRVRELVGWYPCATEPAELIVAGGRVMTPPKTLGDVPGAQGLSSRLVPRPAARVSASYVWAGKLVRGAYMVSERKRACQEGREPPVFEVRAAEDIPRLEVASGACLEERLLVSVPSCSRPQRCRDFLRVLREGSGEWWGGDGLVENGNSIERR